MLPALLRSVVVAGGRVPYTFDWPCAKQRPEMVIDLDRHFFGLLKLGEHIDAARHLGKPSRYHRHEGNGCGLFYDAFGFYLEFGKNRCLSLGIFYVAPNPADSQSAVAYAPIDIRDRGRLGPDCTEQYVRSIFGAPNDTQSDEEETVLCYNLNGLMLDFTFSQSRRLFEVSIALEDRE